VGGESSVGVGGGGGVRGGGGWFLKKQTRGVGGVEKAKKRHAYRRNTLEGGEWKEEAVQGK